MLSETMLEDAGMSCQCTWKPHREETENLAGGCPGFSKLGEQMLSLRLERFGMNSRAGITAMCCIAEFLL